MKTLIAALAFIALLSAPTFAAPGEYYNVSPSSSQFGDNGN
jgi:hypothetical protein